MGKRGGRVWTDGNDEENIARGVFDTYVKRNLRYSQARARGRAGEVYGEKGSDAQGGVAAISAAAPQPAWRAGLLAHAHAYATERLRAVP